MRTLRLVLMSVLVALGLIATPTAAAQQLDTPARTQIAVQFVDGRTAGTADSHESRPALSLTKLHLGYWVLYHGAPADKARVEHMIATSDDSLANQLDARYPQAIPEIIRDFNLTGTSYNGYWGLSTTSASDMARFLAEIRHDPVAQPLFAGMANAAPVAGDGYPQNFGTATIPGAQGTKFGWSNNRDVHATVSFGDGWVMAANTNGTAADHTADVQPFSWLVNPTGAAEDVAAGQPGVSARDILEDLDCLDPQGSSQEIARHLPD